MVFCSSLSQLLNLTRDILILLHIILIFFFFYLSGRTSERKKFFLRFLFLVSLLLIILLIVLLIKLNLPTLRPIFYCNLSYTFSDRLYFNDSFPSSHTAISMALFLFSFYYLNQFKYLPVISLILTLIIAFLSYLSLMHWLSDIIFGAAFSIAIFYILHFLTRRYL